MTSRRTFLSTLGVIAAGVVCRSPGNSSSDAAAAQAATRAARRRLDRIGIQLYSVRTLMQRDVAATLAQIAQIGYKEVEFAGYFGRTPAQIRSLLEQHRLTAPSAHTGIELLGKDWDRALDEAKAAGHDFVTIPWIPQERRSLAAYQRIADDFNRAGERARARGLRFAYHNHDFEFVRTDGAIPLDVLLERTDPALVSYELDIYWAVKGGVDPQAYITRYPGRITMLHVKDSAGAPDHTMVDVGSGTIDFAAILRTDADGPDAIKHVFVEHDQPADPMEFARRSFAHMNALEF